MTLDDDDAPVYPLIGYAAGVVEGAVAVRLEFATSEAEYETRRGEREQFVMSPDAAIALGEVLLARGRLAKGAA